MEIFEEVELENHLEKGVGWWERTTCVEVVLEVADNDSIDVDDEEDAVSGVATLGSSSCNFSE